MDAGQRIVVFKFCFGLVAICSESNIVTKFFVINNDSYLGIDNRHSEGLVHRIVLSRWWADWQRSLVLVQPATVLRWRRRGLWLIWGFSSRGRWRGGRPRIDREIRALIVRMSRENFLWGAPRIHGELLKLGFNVSQATVSRYMPRRSYPPTQSWRTFLRN